jgi:glutamate synthase (NADPH/NADH) large chain
MSGGVAYVYDPDGEFEEKANTEMVSLSRSLEGKDEQMITRLVENHHAYTDSERAAELLEEWDEALDQFVKIMPDAYAEVIDERERDDVRNEPPASATVEADTVEPDVVPSDD